MKTNVASDDAVQSLFVFRNVKITCRAEGVEPITSAAACNARAAFCSPSASRILALASRQASASAAIERCSWTGIRTSLLPSLNLKFKTQTRENGDFYKNELLGENLHSDPLHFDSPVISHFGQNRLNDEWNRLAFWQNVRQVLRTQHVSQSCSGQ